MVITCYKNIPKTLTFFLFIDVIVTRFTAVSGKPCSGEVGVLLCSRLARALSVFESEWVQFEEAYVQDLIRIETLARIPLERAVGSELRLVNLEHAKFHS